MRHHTSILPLTAPQVALGRLLAGFSGVGGGTQKEDAPGNGVVGVDDGGEGTAG